MDRKFKLLFLLLFVGALATAPKTASATSANVTVPTIGATSNITSTPTSNASATTAHVTSTPTTTGAASTITVPPTSNVSATTANVTSTPITTGAASNSTVPPTSNVSATTANVTSTPITTGAASNSTVPPTSNVPATTANVTSTPITTGAASNSTVPPTPNVPATTANVTSTPITTGAASNSTVPPTPNVPATTANVTSTPITTGAASNITVPPTPNVPATTANVTSTPITTGAASNITSSPTSNVSATTVSTVTELPDPCKSNPCGHGSTCEARAGEAYVCLCLPGDTYNEDRKSCESAKVFPGKLNLARTYDPKMADKTSIEFEITADDIVTELTETFGAKGGVPTVVELWPFTPPTTPTPSNVLSRSEPDLKTGATVEIVFKADSPITTENVKELITAAITSEAADILKGATYDESDLCKENPCDLETSNCSSSDGKLSCICFDGYIYSNFSNFMCLACPSGQKANGTKSCINCSFGYSGFNCNDSWELVLVIVGSVLGGLLLITIILLPIIATKGSKKSSKKKKNKDTGNTYVNSSPVKSPLVNSSFAISNPTSVKGGSGNGLSSFANAGVPRIPRATSNNSWDNRTSLEMTPSNSRQNLMPVGRNQRLYEDTDDMNSSPYAQRRPQDNPYAQNRPQSNLYAQNRPQSNPYAQDRLQSNPYAQNRPQSNPYASSQGMTNSYYVHDDGRRFN